MKNSNNHDGQLRAMSLIASLRTAAEVCHLIALRRAGEDPSEQEAEQPVRERLGMARRELREVVVKLRLSLVVGQNEETALVRAFEDRMLLAQAARDLHVVHQRLLSLYPAVASEMVEEARQIQAEAARLAAGEDDGFRDAVVAWCDAAAGFSAALGRALYTAN